MNITYRKKLVINLGNYQSVSHELGIEDKVNFETENESEAYERIKAFVNTKLKEEVNKSVKA